MNVVLAYVHLMNFINQMKATTAVKGLAVREGNDIVLEIKYNQLKTTSDEL